MFSEGGKGQGCTCNSFRINCRQVGAGLTDVMDPPLDGSGDLMGACVVRTLNNIELFGNVRH